MQKVHCMRLTKAHFSVTWVIKLCTKLSINRDINYNKVIKNSSHNNNSRGCHHSSVDSSVPSNLPTWVRLPSTPSMLNQFIYELCHVEKEENKQKEAGIGP